MRYRMLLRAILVFGMGAATLATPKRAPAASMQVCYTCWWAEVCSDYEGSQVCAQIGGELCPRLATCQWPGPPACASNQVFYTCTAAG